MVVREALKRANAQESFAVPSCPELNGGRLQLVDFERVIARRHAAGAQVILDQSSHSDVVEVTCNDG